MASESLELALSGSPSTGGRLSLRLLRRLPPPPPPPLLLLPPSVRLLAVRSSARPTAAAVLDKEDVEGSSVDETADDGALPLPPAVRFRQGTAACAVAAELALVSTTRPRSTSSRDVGAVESSSSATVAPAPPAPDSSAACCSAAACSASAAALARASAATCSGLAAEDSARTTIAKS